MNEPTTVTVFTATGQFGFEPRYEDGALNTGEVKRAAALITSEYANEYQHAALIESLTKASPGSSITFPGGEEVVTATEPTEHEKIEQRYAERNDFDRLTPEEEAHRAKVLAKPYKPSPGFGPDGFPLPAGAAQVPA